MKDKLPPVTPLPPAPPVVRKDRSRLDQAYLPQRVGTWLERSTTGRWLNFPRLPGGAGLPGGNGVPAGPRRSPAVLTEYLQKISAGTGYEEISLTSLSSADYTKIEEIMASLTDCFAAQNVKLSLPSLRIDSFSPELAARFQGERKGGLTFAPEAGTERLRRVINKNLTDEQIMQTTEAALPRAGSG